jgi:3-hydroxyisobutyrate dehydrogenase
MRVAVLGLGEAGGRYGADLAAAGWQVSGYDPAPVRTPPGVLRAGGCYADFNSASAADKRGVEQAVAPALVLVADVAVLAPVGRSGAVTPLLASGPGASLVAAALEADAAGRAAGREQWVRDQMAAELGPGGQALVQRLIQGSAAHAARRIHEVAASREVLCRLGVPADVCDAAISWLGWLRDRPGGIDGADPRA